MTSFDPQQPQQWNPPVPHADGQSPYSTQSAASASQAYGQADPYAASAASAQADPYAASAPSASTAYQQGQPHYPGYQDYQQQSYQSQPGYGGQPYAGQQASMPAGQLAYPSLPAGTIRSSAMVLVLSFITLGIYSLYWMYVTHDELKRTTGAGLGGAVALILSILGLGIVLVFTLPGEVEEAFRQRGWASPVSAVYGLWIFMPFIGYFVWQYQVNEALNTYWRSLGVREG